jgi:hypothetical protein
MSSFLLRKAASWRRLFLGLSACRSTAATNVLVENEPAWQQFLAAVRDFLASLPQQPEVDYSRAPNPLSSNELEVLALVPDGRSNASRLRPGAVDLCIGTTRSHQTQPLQGSTAI